MGNQQLLLILLGVVIVGIAVAVGISLTREYYDDSVGDSVQASLMRLVTEAYEFHEKPKSMGGGGHTFIGFVIPESYHKDLYGMFGIGKLHNGIFISAYLRGGTSQDQMTVAIVTTPSFMIDWDGYGKFAKWDTPDYVPFP
jgi:hypothetical protein